MLFSIFYISFLLLVVNAMHNVTVDDNDPSITYQPPDSWLVSVFDVLDAGGTHRVTSDPDATASFTFTGVAIYFYSPLWTFQVTTLVALDGLSPVLLDLRDYSQPLDIDGPESVQSSVVWSQAGLANTKHTLLVSVAPGQTLAILDTLVYTVLDANNTVSSSSTSSASSLPSSTSTPNPSTASENSSKKGLAVTLGVVCTVFGLLVITGIWWFIRWGQRRDDYDHPSPQTSNNHNHSPHSTNNLNTPADNYSSPTTFRGRDSSIRSIPTTAEIASITNNTRRNSTTITRPASSTIRHYSTSTISSPSSKLKNQLTPIPEALPETSLARQDSFLLSSPSAESPRTTNTNEDRDSEEPWTNPHR